MWRTLPVHQQKYNKISKIYICEFLLKCIIFLTRDDLEKLQMQLELLRMQCLWSFDEWQKQFQIILLTNTLNLHEHKKKIMNPVLCFLKSMVSHSILGL